MNPLETFLSWTTLAAEIALCGFVVAHRVYRVIPFFALYAGLLLTCTTGVWLIYAYFGFTSNAAYYGYWTSVVINASARGLAIAELCRYGMRMYAGIWKLVCGALALVLLGLAVHAVGDAWGQPNGIAVYGATFDREVALASVVVLIVVALFQNHYDLPSTRLQRLISAGIGFICLVDFVGNTVFRNVLTRDLYAWFLSSQKALWPSLAPFLQRVDDIWSTAHLLSFVVSIGIWCYALRAPLPAAAPNPVLLPAGVYRELSPAINMRLATFNDRLVELLKS